MICDAWFLVMSATLILGTYQLPTRWIVVIVAKEKELAPIPVQLILSKSRTLDEKAIVSSNRTFRERTCWFICDINATLAGRLNLYTVAIKHTPTLVSLIHTQASMVDSSLCIAIVIKVDTEDHSARENMEMRVL